MIVSFRYNAYRFFVQNVIRVSKEDGIELQFSAKLKGSEETDKTQWNIMDRWVLSATQSLISWFKQEMQAYRLYTVVPVLVKFIDQLTNWYVRLNRRRLKVSFYVMKMHLEIMNFCWKHLFLIFRGKRTKKIAARPLKFSLSFCLHWLGWWHRLHLSSQSIYTKISEKL